MRVVMSSACPGEGRRYRKYSLGPTLVLCAILQGCASTPLDVLKKAVTNNDVALAAELIERGANPQDLVFNDQLALNYALLHREERMARLLLVHGVDPNRKDSAGRPAIAFLSPQFRLEVSPVLQDPISLILYELTGEYACSAELSSETIALLIASVHDLDALFSGRTSGQVTALMQASGCGHVATMQTLLARGAKPDASSDNGVTAIAVAAAAGNADAVQLLIANGATADSHDVRGVTPLMLASRETSKGANETVDLLIAAHADPNARDARGESSLMYAVRSSGDTTTIIRTLRSAGANADLMNAKGESARSLRAAAFANEPTDGGFRTPR